ncbi:hypothetical protein B484DRAFT_455187 [Ochromonadaceae sp. CCMP2298]|nr:hypothetical protein B484DRAFT_455187 [Ochromonadaceae sp. CCMP2298]
MAATKKRKSEGGEGETADDLEEHRAQDEIRTQEGQEGQEEGDERVVRAQLQDITNALDRLRDQDMLNHNEEQSAKNNLQTEMSRLNQSTSSLQSRIVVINKDIKQLTKSSNKTLGVLRKIEQYRSRFREPVLGPVGTCISIKDGCDMWAGAVARGIGGGGLFSSFVVQDVRDRKTLLGIIREVGGAALCGHHQIIYQQLHPRSNVQTPSMRGVDLLTIADVINAPDGVFNMLVGKGIHLIGLQQHEASISNFVHKVNNRDTLMHNLISMISANGTVVTLKGGNMSSESMNKPFKNLLLPDTAAIATLRVELQQNEQELHEHQGEIRRTQEDITALDEKLRGIEAWRNNSDLSVDNRREVGVKVKAQADGVALQRDASASSGGCASTQEVRPGMQGQIQEQEQPEAQTEAQPKSRKRQKQAESSAETAGTAERADRNMRIKTETETGAESAAAGAVAVAAVAAAEAAVAAAAATYIASALQLPALLLHQLTSPQELIHYLDEMKDPCSCTCAASGPSSGPSSGSASSSSSSSSASGPGLASVSEQEHVHVHGEQCPSRRARLWVGALLQLGLPAKQSLDLVQALKPQLR